VFGNTIAVSVAIFGGTIVKVPPREDVSSIDPFDEAERIKVPEADGSCAV
jgi:hypothetical protein